MINYNTDEIRNKIFDLNLMWVHDKRYAFAENVCTPHGEYAVCLYLSFLWLINRCCPPQSLRRPRHFRACTVESINFNGGATRYRTLRDRGYVGRDNGTLIVVEERVNIQINALHRFAEDPEPFLIGFDYNI
jgi:hypothetical protein